MAQTARQRQDQKNDYTRKLTTEAANIAPIPAIQNPKRRAACSHDLQQFCESYFPEVFNRTWSADHLIVIDLLEQAILQGGLFAVAMPRAFGKTSICVAAAIWSIIYGHRKFVTLIGATEQHAVNLLKNLAAHLAHSQNLMADFPEVCWPIHSLAGNVNRAKSQHVNGERTLIGWTTKQLTMPVVKGSAASGSVVVVAGITGSIRGLQHVTPDGAVVRPDLVLVDDPQTRESAFSTQQTIDRLAIINGDILGLAGHGKKISAVMPCTVITSGDLAEQVLDRDRCPDWQGVRTRMLISEPSDSKVWEAYAQVRADALRAGDRAAATAYYLQHQSALDAGAEASWTDCYDVDEASAIQHAMNLKLRNEQAFAAEYQNAPIQVQTTMALKLSPTDVLAKVIKTRARGVVPVGTTKLTAFIDVQQSVLFWMVCAFNESFDCHVVDYGCYPEQQRTYFNLRDLKSTLQTLLPKADLQGQIYQGLDQLTKTLAARSWPTEAGTPITLTRIMVDCGYETATVTKLCRDSTLKAILLPSKGLGVTADRRPLNEYRAEDGVRMGWNWRHKVADTQVLFDANEWKTFAAQRVLAPVGSIGTVTIFNASDVQHQLLADHWSAETGLPMESKAHGRTTIDWKNIMRQENHWYDCLIGCFVAASEQGILAQGHQPADVEKKTRRRRPVSVKF